MFRSLFSLEKRYLNNNKHSILRINKCYLSIKASTFIREKYMKKKYSVLEIDDTGKMQTFFRTSEDFIYDGKSNKEGIFARDLFALNLGNADHLVQGFAKFKSSSSVILPRHHAIVISLGYIKTIIGRNKIIVFEYDKPLVKQWAHNLMLALRKNYKYPYFNEVLSFELFVFEDILKCSSETFERRFEIFNPLVENMLQDIDKQADAFAGVDSLLPIRDALQIFEMDVKETQKCLMTLLENDNDMAELMLSEKNEATGAVDISRHVVVELLVESYAARLSHTITNLILQQQKVKSRFEVAEISVQRQRNRILRMNLHCGIAGVSIGLSTIVSSSFGMNVDLPSIPTWLGSEFHTIVGFSLIIPIALYFASFEFLRGTGLQQIAKKRTEQMLLLESIFSDMNALDYAMKESYNTINVDEENYEEVNDGLKKSSNTAGQITNNVEDKSSNRPDDIFEDIRTKNEFAMNIYNHEKGDDDKKKLWRKGKKVTKADFANFMRTARGGKEVDSRTVDVFFDILDDNKDGFLSMSEKLEAEENNNTTSQLTNSSDGIRPESLNEFSKNLRKPF